MLERIDLIQVHMKDRKQKSAKSQTLGKDKLLKFDELVQAAKVMEMQINEKIREFEKNHQLKCWVSIEKNNEVNIDISIDSEKLK